MNNEKCPTCRSILFKDEEGPYCLCGWRPRAQEPSQELKENKVEEVKPENWKKMGNKAKSDWYNKHQADIENDLVKVGVSATLAKWDITIATFVRLTSRWGGEKPPPHPLEEKLKPVALPPFPEFDSSWRPEVQIRWLEIYKELYQVEKK